MSDVNKQSQSRSPIHPNRKPNHCYEHLHDPNKKSKVQFCEFDQEKFVKQELASIQNSCQLNPEFKKEQVHDESFHLLNENGISSHEDGKGKSIENDSIILNRELDPPGKREMIQEENEKKYDVDQKGKGNMIQDEGEKEESEDSSENDEKKLEVDRKGKGKLMEDDDDSSEEDDDDSSDVVSGCDYESEDDPLNEVDLNNILPSRTRRKIRDTGFYISNNPEESWGDSDSDDSDA